MAQHDMNIANQGFPATRADLNNALQALVSNSSGTSAPSTTFANQWWYDTTNNKMYLRNEANNAWIEVFTLDQTNNEWQIVTGQISAADGDGIAFKTDDGTTRVTLDDSGNLLVGTTDNNPNNNNAGSAADNGIKLGPEGLVSVAAYDNPTQVLNRTGTVGTICDIRKDGTTVGTIGTQSGTDFFVTSGSTANTGLRFQTDEIVPVTNAAANRDNAIDIGKSNIRFKDLYLSGGAYIGGTVAANYLDDYEEGTWTCTLGPSGGFTPTSNTSTGYYTKIGRQVTATAYAIMTAPSSLGSYSNNSTSFSLKVTGLPFTIDNALGFRSAPVIGVSDNIQVVDGYLSGHGSENSTSVAIYQTKDNGGTRSSPTISASAAINFHFCFTYFT